MGLAGRVHISLGCLERYSMLRTFNEVVRELGRDFIKSKSCIKFLVTSTSCFVGVAMLQAHVTENLLQLTS